MNRKYEKWYMRGRDILITATAVQSWKKKRKERKEEKNERSIDFEGLKRVLPMPRGSRYKKCTPIPRSAYFNVFILPYESSSLVASCLLNALKRTLPPPRDTLVSNVRFQKQRQLFCQLSKFAPRDSGGYSNAREKQLVLSLRDT